MTQTTTKTINRFKTIFLSTPEAIIIVGVESGEIIDVNPACSALSGYAYNELIGMNQKDLLQNFDESISEEYVNTHNNFDKDSYVNINVYPSRIETASFCKKIQCIACPDALMVKLSP